MQSLIIAHARNRPECLKDYLPGSEYWSFEEMSRDGSLERLEALAPDFMVIFDAILLKYAGNANRILTYLEIRKQTAPSCGDAPYEVPVSVLCLSPEEATRRGLLAKLALDIRNNLMETP